MDADEALRLIEDLIRNQGEKPLNDLQRILFKGAWAGKDYKEINQDCGQPVKLEHLMRNVGPKLWKLLSTVLSEAIGEAVSVKKDYLRGSVERLLEHLKNCDSIPSPNESANQIEKPAFGTLQFLEESF